MLIKWKILYVINIVCLHTFKAENYTTKNLHRKWCTPLQQATLINGKNSSTTKLNMFFIRFMYLRGKVGGRQILLLAGSLFGPVCQEPYVLSVGRAGRKKCVYTHTHTLFTMLNEDVCIIIIKIKVHFYMFVKNITKIKQNQTIFYKCLKKATSFG